MSWKLFAHRRFPKPNTRRTYRPRLEVLEDRRLLAQVQVLNSTELLTETFDDPKNMGQFFFTPLDDQGALSSTYDPSTGRTYQQVGVVFHHDHPGFLNQGPPYPGTTTPLPGEMAGDLMFGPAADTITITPYLPAGFTTGQVDVAALDVSRSSAVVKFVGQNKDANGNNEVETLFMPLQHSAGPPALVTLNSGSGLPANSGIAPPAQANWDTAAASKDDSLSGNTLGPIQQIIVQPIGYLNTQIDNVRANVTLLTAPTGVVVVSAPNFEGGTVNVSSNLKPGVSFTLQVDWGDGTTSSQFFGPGAPSSISHVYVEEGNFPILLTATDQSGLSASAHATAVVSDAPLAATGRSLGGRGGVGAAMRVASFTDANANAVFTDYTATINWGDGTTSVGTISGSGPFEVTGTHTYGPDGGTFSISITITDVGGEGAAAASTAFILAAPPVLAPIPDQTVNEGDLLSFTASATDPVPGATLTYGLDPGFPPGAQIDPSTGVFTYRANPRDLVPSVSARVTVRVTDTRHTSASQTFTISVVNLPPTLSQMTVSGAAVEGSASVQLSGAVFDPGFQVVPMRVAEERVLGYVDWGDGSVGESLFDARAPQTAPVPFSKSHQYQEEGTYQISVRAIDSGSSPGLTASFQATIVVNDAPLSATAPLITLNEGDVFNGTVATLVDSNSFPISSPDFTYSVDWGDGQTTRGNVAYHGGGPVPISGSHFYPDGGSYAVTVQITDDGGSQTTVQTTANVIDPPLLATRATVSPIAGAPFAGAVASFTDTDPREFPFFPSHYSATISWGDGSSSSGTIQYVGGSRGYDVTNSHTYAAAGSFQITVTILDPEGSTATAISTANVTALGQAVQPGLTSGTGFWHNPHGQALINAFNGGGASTALATWLAATFPNLYGAAAGASNLAGMSNAQVADFYTSLFHQKGPKLEAQVLSVALDVYATTLSLGGTTAAQYGFTVTAYGLGAYSFTVGDGDAFGVPDHTTLNVFQILKAVDRQSVNGILYNGDRRLRHQAHDLFADLIDAGGI